MEELQSLLEQAEVLANQLRDTNDSPALSKIHLSISNAVSILRDRPINDREPDEPCYE